MDRRSFLSILGLGVAVPSTAVSSSGMTQETGDVYRVISLGNHATRAMLSIKNELDALGGGKHLFASFNISHVSTDLLIREVINSGVKNIFIAGFTCEPRVAATLPDLCVKLSRHVNDAKIIPLVMTPGAIVSHRFKGNARRCLARLRKERRWCQLSYENMDEVQPSGNGVYSHTQQFTFARQALAEIVMDRIIGRLCFERDKLIQPDYRPSQNNYASEY